MQIDAIRGNLYSNKATVYSDNRLRTNNSQINKSNLNSRIAIAFKGGNENHLFHQVSEMEIFGQKSGGVATVGNDLFFFPLSHNDIKDFDRVIENLPLYNQEVIYRKEFDSDGKLIGIKEDGVKLRRIPFGLPENHPFKKYEGEVYTTALQIDHSKDITSLLAKPDNYNKIFILDLVGEKNMDWGLEKEVPTGMYILRKDDRMKAFLRSKGWDEEQLQKIDITLTYVDSTASMPRPYADGSYSTATGTDKLKRDMSAKWRGAAYAKEAKATAECLPFLKEKFDFDPKYITCHDGQAMPLIQFMAVKNAEGIPYYQDKVITAVGHNLNDGYLGNLYPKDVVIALAKPGEIEKIVTSDEYKQALIEGKEEEFLKTLVPKELFDKRGQFNAVMFPIVYGEKGYLPMFSTVSHNYYESIIENEIITPAVQQRLKELSNQGVLKGILNVLMNPLATPFNDKALPEYHRQDVKVKKVNGEEVTLPRLQAFDENAKYDLDSVRKIKQQNKIALLKRLDTSLAGAQLWGKDDKNTMAWLNPNSGYNAAAAGSTSAKFEILGGIDKNYIKMLEEGKDVPMFVFWGRGDWQKGAETGLKAWMKYVKNTGDKDSIYLLGGPLEAVKEVPEIMKKIESGTDPEYSQFKGRVLCQMGWAPGFSYASAADYATFASRFAPCELTDLEAMKKLCIPIVPKVQGMDQKVFDPTDNTDKVKYVNGYKGKYEYYMTEAKALEAANEDERKIFNKAKENLIKAIENDFKAKLGNGEDIPDYYIKKQLEAKEDYRKALQRLRDSVIEDDMANSIERAIKDRNTDIAKKILKNHVDLKTTWEENGWCNPTGESAADLYRKYHYNKDYKGKNLNKGEELKLDLSRLTSRNKKNRNKNGEAMTSFWGKCKKWAKTKHGKWTIGIAGGAAVATGIGYLGYKAGWITPDMSQRKKNKHLSQIV